MQLMRSTERDSGDSSASSAPVSLLERASLVLGCFGPDHTDIGVSDIARRTGLAKSTTHRLVACCETKPVLMASIKPTEMPTLKSKATNFRGL